MRDLSPPVSALRLRGVLHRARARPLSGATALRLCLRPRRGERRRHVGDGASVPCFSGDGAQGGRPPRPCRRAHRLSRPRIEMGCPRPGARHRRPRGPARGLGAAPAPALQGPAPGTRNPRDPRYRRTLEPLGYLAGDREPPGAVPLRPRFEPELTGRAARAARALPGCRRHERDHPLSGGRPCPII